MIRPSLTVLCLVALLAQPALAQRDELVPVEQYVTSPAFHGMEYPIARRYGSEAVPRLIRLLKTEEVRPHWSNVVWLLGVIATPEAASALIEFQEKQFAGVVDPETLRALLLVGPALGFSAHDPEREAFKYLREGADPTQIAKRKLAWSGKGWQPGSREIMLAKLSVNGLGLAGNRAAVEALENLRKEISGRDPETWRFLAPNVEESIELARRIDEVGYERALAERVQKRGPRRPRTEKERTKEPSPSTDSETEMQQRPDERPKQQ